MTSKEPENTLIEIDELINLTLSVMTKIMTSTCHNVYRLYLNAFTSSSGDICCVNLALLTHKQEIRSSNNLNPTCSQLFVHFHVVSPQEA